VERAKIKERLARDIFNWIGLIAAFVSSAKEVILSLSVNIGKIIP